MEKYNPSRSDIHFLARGLLITKEGNIILCRAKGKEWFFLPGGHIDNGESSREALIREIHEEIGDIGQKISSFIGISENIFQYDEGSLQHEINIIFEVDVSREEVESQRDHIEFVTIRSKDIKDTKILPEEIKEGILSWLKTKEPFFKEIEKI